MTLRFHVCLSIFFFLGSLLLLQLPSRNTHSLILTANNRHRQRVNHPSISFETFVVSSSITSPRSTLNVNETRAKLAAEKRLVRNNSSRRWLQGSAATALTSKEQSNFKTVHFRSSRFQERTLRLSSSLVYCLDRKIGSRPVFTFTRTFVSSLLFLYPRVSSFSKGSRRTSTAVPHNSNNFPFRDPRSNDSSSSPCLFVTRRVICQIFPS